MLWIAELAFGGTDLLPADSGENAILRPGGNPGLNQISPF